MDGVVSGNSSTKITFVTFVTFVLDERELCRGTRPVTRYGEVWELGLGVKGHERVRMTDVNGRGDVVVPDSWDAGGNREISKVKDWAASRLVTIAL